MTASAMSHDAAVLFLCSPLPVAAFILGPFAHAYYHFQDQLFSAIIPASWTTLMVAPFKIAIDQVPIFLDTIFQPAFMTCRVTVPRSLTLHVAFPSIHWRTDLLRSGL